MRLRSVVAVSLWMAMQAVAGAQENASAKPLPMKAVKFGKLWDGKGKVWTNAIVIVEGERVREVLRFLVR